MLIFIQVNDIISAINSESTLDMTNKKNHTALITPNAEIILIPSDLERKQKLCLRANGTSAKKKKITLLLF